MPHFLAVGFAVLLTACATPRAPVQTPPVSGLDQTAPWVLQGRIAIKAGENSQSGQLQWQHRQDQDALMVLTPLGQGVARIVRDASGVTLEIPNQPLRRAPYAESLTREAMGVALPLSGLRHWILVRPDPLRPFELTRNANGRVAQILQDGWAIDYLQYMSDTDPRPRKINIVRDNLEIRLVVDTWELQSIPR